MITGLSHTGLVVRDMGKMIDFYHDAFGFQKVLDTIVSGKETDDIVNFHVERERIVLMQLGEMQIEMLEYRPHGRSYPDDYKSNDSFGVHLALKTDDIERDFAMLKDKGVKIISKGPQTIPKEHLFSLEQKFSTSWTPKDIPLS